MLLSVDLYQTHKKSVVFFFIYNTILYCSNLRLFYFDLIRKVAINVFYLDSYYIRTLLHGIKDLYCGYDRRCSAANPRPSLQSTNVLV